jgi:hypothetical protein
LLSNEQPAAARSYGQHNEHNATLSRGTRLKDWEKQVILDNCHDHPDDSYRQLTCMMLADVVAARPSGVYRVLKAADRLGRPGAPSGKGTGVVLATQPQFHFAVNQNKSWCS